MNVLNKWLLFIEKTVMSIGIIATSLIITYNIILRYIFDSGIVWAEEATRYIIIYIVMIGSSYAIAKEEHISVTLLNQTSIKWISHVMYVFQNLVSLVFTVLFSYYGIQLLQMLMSTNQLTPALQIPIWWIYAAMPIGMTMMSIRYVLKLANWILTRQLPENDTTISGGAA